MGKRMKKITAVLLAGVTASLACACGQEGVLEDNLVKNKEDRVKTVMLFAPMEKSDPDNENVSRTAFDITVGMAEEKLGVTVEYRVWHDAGISGDNF